VLVSGQWVILRHEQLPRAQHDECHSRRAPWLAADRLGQRDARTGEPRPRSRRGDEDHQHGAREILGAKEEIEDVAPLRLLRIARIQRDECGADEARQDAAQREVWGLHWAQARSSSA
jgi:hypothetical protein